MKIEGNSPYLRPDFESRQRETVAQQQEEQKAQEQQSRQDRLELSITGRELQQLTQTAAESSVVRTERVAEIQAQIEAGTYNIKAEEIAEAIITGHLLDKSV